MIVKPFCLDKTKVKRIFTYGCSYTSYFWPTWANIISKEFPDAEFYNFGRIGSGNLAISCRIAETNARFKFNEHDLVMVMWSSYTRNDHWIFPEGWFGAGSVFNEGFYNDEYRSKFANSLSGFLIREFALMNMTRMNLDSLPCQSIIMSSVPSNYYDHAIIDDREKDIIEKLNELYASDFKNQPMTLLGHLNKHVKNSINWKFYPSHRYKYDGMPTHGTSTLYEDTHPSPKTYAEYLNNNIIELSQSSLDYATQSYTDLKKLENMREIEDYFKTNNIKESLLF